MIKQLGDRGIPFFYASVLLPERYAEKFLSRFTPSVPSLYSGLSRAFIEILLIISFFRSVVKNNRGKKTPLKGVFRQFAPSFCNKAHLYAERDRRGTYRHHLVPESGDIRPFVLADGGKALFRHPFGRFRRKFSPKPLPFDLLANIAARGHRAGKHGRYFYAPSFPFRPKRGKKGDERRLRRAVQGEIRHRIDARYAGNG